MEYFATGSQLAMQYFYINPTTGDVSAKQTLQNDVSFNNDVYTVRKKDNFFTDNYRISLAIRQGFSLPKRTTDNFSFPKMTTND